MNAPFYRRLSTGAHMFLHPCAECGDENAPFGFGVELRKGKPGVWLCRKHKEKGDEYAARQAVKGGAAGRTEAGIAHAQGGVSEVHSEGTTDKGTGGFSDSLFDLRD